MKKKTTQKTKKKLCCGEKHPFKSVSCPHFTFHCSDKTRTSSETVAGNKAFVLANLMHNRIIIVVNTRVKLL